jgi:hypothetical protein
MTDTAVISTNGRGPSPKAVGVSGLITRDELLETLEQRGFDVPLSSLRYWEYIGAIPKPIRKWDPTVRAVRAMYPLAAVETVVEYIKSREVQPCPLCGGTVKRINRRYKPPGTE